MTALMWLSIGIICSGPSCYAIGVWNERARQNMADRKRAADLRHDLINHVRLKAAARHAALAGQEWPPLPSDDVMHGSAS